MYMAPLYVAVVVQPHHHNDTIIIRLLHPWNLVVSLKWSLLVEHNYLQKHFIRQFLLKMYYLSCEHLEI